MKATVWVEQEVEVTVTAQDCMTALANLEAPERLRLALNGLNSVLSFAKLVPDDVIASMNDAQREIVRSTLEEQMQRYLTPNDLPPDERQCNCEHGSSTPPWQPIETAPKDGTHILAKNSEYGARETYWRLYGDGSIAKARSEKGEGPSGAWDWTEPKNNLAASWVPDEWMPLPPNAPR